MLENTRIHDAFGISLVDPAFFYIIIEYDYEVYTGIPRAFSFYSAILAFMSNDERLREELRNSSIMKFPKLSLRVELVYFTGRNYHTYFVAR